MPVSTSLNSSIDFPRASSSRRKSFSAMLQPAMSLMKGKASAQALSKSSFMPAAAGAVLKAIMQRLSRSALENSQLPPAIALAWSLTGACARAPTTTRLAMAKANRTTRIMGPSGANPSRSSTPPFRWPRRFGHRRQRSLAGGPGGEIVDHQLVHLGARPFRRRTEMGEQHDVVHLQQRLRHLRLRHIAVEAGRIDLLLLQGPDQRRLVDHRAPRHADQATPPAARVKHLRVAHRLPP